MVSLKISGLDAAIKGIENKVKVTEQEIQNELNAWALDTVNYAKQYSPVDEGHLRGAINHDSGKLKAGVTVAVDYAAYLEFGTRKFAASYVSSLPSDWQDFAAQFKGGGGDSFQVFVKRITEWVARKGIDKKAAYPIALKIIREGIKAHPYLYPATQKTTPELIKNIKELLSK